MNERETKPRIIPNVDRALTLLELLSESPHGLRFAEVCSALSLAKSSAFVLLESLEAKGYVEKTPEGKYRATLRLFRLGSRVLAHLDIRSIALPHMTRLRDETGFPVHLAMLDGADVVYLEKVDTAGFVKFDTYVGKRAPIHLTSVGKAIAAFLPEEQLERLMNSRGLTGGTEKAVTTQAQLKHALKTVRGLGFALDDEEEVLGVRCIGAPVRDHSGAPVAAISIIGLHRELPAVRFPEYGARLVETARRISLELGCPEPIA